MAASIPVRLHRWVLAAWRTSRGITPILSVLVLVALVGAQAAASTLPRAMEDRPDDSPGSQVHLMYVVPSDGEDQSLDTDGTIQGSVSSFQRWLESETGGKTLRIDTFEGSMDISFFRLSRTDAEMKDHDPFIRDEIEAELEAAGFDAPNKIYAVYYDGSSNHSCGGGAWPPNLPGRVAALYLLGEPPGAPSCNTNIFATADEAPRYLEFAMLHEIMHTLGFVAECAPHHHLAGHVSDSNRDLMWAGEAPWDIFRMVLDVGRDDYFGHDVPACLDVADSTFLIDAGRSDLALTKTDPPGRQPTGRNMTYTLTVTNNGPDEASDVVVTDTLPSSVTFVDAGFADPLPVGYCDPPSGGVVTCYLGPIASGGSRSVLITVKPTQAGIITNSASVASPTTDPNQANNADSEDTSICRITSRRSSIPCG